MKGRYIDSLMQVLKGGSPARVVWTADVTYWISGEKAAGRADPAWETEEGYLKLHQDLGVMAYYYYPKFWTGEPVYDGGIEIHVEHKDNDTITTITTPVGEVSQIETYLPASVSVGCTRHFIQSDSDLDVFSYIIEGVLPKMI